MRNLLQFKINIRKSHRESQTYQNSCAKIACFSNELIFTSPNTGSIIQNASEQFVSCTLHSSIRIKLPSDTTMQNCKTYACILKVWKFCGKPYLYSVNSEQPQSIMRSKLISNLHEFYFMFRLKFVQNGQRNLQTCKLYCSLTNFN